ncbi:sulfatase-like hydrolase/transferase [Pelagicoccus mobilis]|uniref:Sulfatase-like hydrolase/transferase n=1 Tax=Pelagicoccus mobilis TaxID=415221 RepID=A0A934VLF8_9BACT|nr:sulfatase-like hydrolase/transferase [Pelagicoccus mobilis]MBK1877701.1 sulfatase-like hydrolase/transferase [Pelagicoccus mobilis]
MKTNQIVYFFGRIASVLLVVTLGCAPVWGDQKGAIERPNVILINIDDMGYTDPSCYGGTAFRTENIDRLAREGIRFTDGYVSAPVCSPSRHGLLTGSHQQRFGIQWNHDIRKLKHREGESIVPPEHKYINQAFSEAGYVTAIVGKFNLPSYPKTTFDYEYSLTSAGSNFFPEPDGSYKGVDGVPKPKGGFEMMLWGPEREGDEYLTDRCGRQSVEFIQANKDRPFFLYLPFNAVHSPFHAKKSHKKMVSHLESEVMQLYAAMAISIDENIGKILDALEEEGLRENTIVVVVSDNGPANPTHLGIPDWWPEDTPYHLIGQCAPLNGYKGSLWEGGIRVPYIVSWPGSILEGAVIENPVSTMDLYPTLCAAAGVKIPENTNLDGVNLLPWMKGYYSEPPHETLFWYANRMGAARMGKWKLLIEDNVHHLFDLEKDLGETRNVMHENPEVMDDIFAKYIAFRNEMPAARNPFNRPIDIRPPEVLDIHPKDGK